MNKRDWAAVVQSTAKKQAEWDSRKLRQELEDVRLDYKELRKTYEVKVTENKALHEECERYKAMCEDLKAKNKTLDISNQHMEKELTAYRKRADDATKDYQTARREVLWLRNRGLWARIVNKVDYYE